MKRQLKKKLNLNKLSIARINNIDAGNIRAGIAPDPSDNENRLISISSNEERGLEVCDRSEDTL